MLRILIKTEKSVRRINHLRAVLNKDNQHVTCSRHKHDGYVSIGNVKVPVKTPQNPELVPYAYVVENKELPQSILRHMKWLAQKDILGQDVFLIGPPGPLRRLIAMQYLELTRKEVEYISLSRDTTESDLKQRREMKQGTSFYIDQCAVRAAVEGRVLIIEGVEKAERNVLPALNNLLENREMQLDDGRFLMHHKRYDQLLQDHSKKTLDDWQLVRVSENFRVFALGLPVPKYRGHPLDPPLRSRFQARDVYHLGFSDQLEELYKTAPSVNETLLAETLSCASALVTQDSANLGLPHFPLDNLIKAAKIMEKLPKYPIQNLLSRLYPYKLVLNKDGTQAVEDIYKKFDISLNSSVDSLVLKDIHHKNNQAAVTLASNQQTHSFKVSCGDHIHGPRSSVKDEFVATPYHQRLLADLMLSHTAMDVCIVGGKGCGKSSVIREFSRLLNYRTEPVLMYQDMTARDLLQQRYTLPNGDTVWKLSPLIEAAMEGGMAVLDGLNRVNPGTLSILQRLVHDREVTLHDGTRLIRHDKFDGMKEKLNLTDQELNEKSVYRIHPSFRMVGVAEPPTQGSSQQWLNPELLTLFLYHHMEPLSINNEMEIIQKLVPDVSLTEIKGLLKLCQKLRSAKDANSVSLAASLSTRQLVRISKRLAASHHNVNRSELVSDAVHKACLSRFFLTIFIRFSFPKKIFLGEIKEGILKIGDVSAPVYTGDNVEAESSVAKVPDVLFYDNAQHLSVMRDMLQDYNLGEHILLVGNQGVGKNKIVDRFLHLLNKPREYLQLHRDTTVQSLTVQPTVRDGIIVYEDSALVRAARLGHALVVDEADKAPTHVTCILKALLESGRATLADGRKIVTASTSNKEVILLHPDFRMFVLANRPGFPFLGNDFFGAVGDVFSCHAVDNPSVSSELDMLRQYGENVPEASLKKLVAAFGELRDLADRGLISYPYSTREVVNIVKHLEKFPKEGLANVVRNVFDFDAYSKETKEQLASVMHKHGIPVGAKPHDTNLVFCSLPLSVPKLSGYWNLLHQSSSQCEVESFEMSVKGPVHLTVQNYDIDRTEDRGLDFSEQFAHWQLPQFFRTNIITDIAISKSGPVDTVNIFAVNGSALYVNQRGSSVVKYIDMYDVFPNVGSMSHANVKIAPLGPSLQGQLLLFEQKSKFLLMIDTNSGATRRLFIPGMEGTSDPHLSVRRSSSTPSTPPYKMCSEFSEEFCTVVFFEENGNIIASYASVFKFICNPYIVLWGKIGHIITSEPNYDIIYLTHDKWLITEADTNIKYMLSTKSVEDNIPNKLTQLTTSLKQAVDSPNRVLVDKNCYAKCVVGFPDLTAANEIYTFPRTNDTDKGRTIYRGMTKFVPPKPPCQILSDSNQVVKIVPLKSVPDTAFNEGIKPSLTTHCMEVADLGQHMLRYVPLPQAVSESPYVSWQSSISESGYNTAVGKNDVLYTVDAGGCVREWETGLMNLKRSLDEWRAMIGSDGGDDRLQITTERESGEDVTAPKHGKIDPDNAPHVGGNTWAGGTGGRDTAGLGGKGGPYRLDMGHDVTQVPDWEKEAVPEHVKKAARDVAKKAFKERLREIRMSEFDADMYEKFSSHVRKQVKSLRIILDSLQAKGKERQWLKHQTTGELDDMKLIEGLTGEKNIYKRRAEQEPEPGTPQQKPKKIRVVMDVSGSMYRFNGLDNRLERSVEAACLVMESFEGYKDKFK
uniref:von Willebrand factor A domain-containing protein 8 n=1 Tax=Ciona intestinalis TaxID=7719 RepID=F6QXZ7_CIOIN